MFFYKYNIINNTSQVVLGLLLLHLINKSLELDGYKTELLESGPIEGLLSISKLHCGDKKKFKKKLETEFLKFDTSGTGMLFMFYKHCQHPPFFFTFKSDYFFLS